MWQENPAKLLAQQLLLAKLCCGIVQRASRLLAAPALEDSVCVLKELLGHAPAAHLHIAGKEQKQHQDRVKTAQHVRVPQHSSSTIPSTASTSKVLAQLLGPLSLSRGVANMVATTANKNQSQTRQ